MELQPAPSTFGRRRFIAGAAVGAGAAALAFPGSTAAQSLPPGASRFVPLSRQIRFADTRNQARFPYGELGDAIRVQITGREGIPSNATAVVLTVTGVNRADGNFLSVYPAGGVRPEVSNLNLAFPTDTAANLATVQLGVGGAVDVYAFAPTEIIVDVAGYYEPVGAPVSEGRFVALPGAVRVIDTRNRDVPLPQSVVEVFITDVVPASASSVAVNLTTTGTLGWGYFTCFPLDAVTPPESSNLNVNGPDETRAAAAIVKVTTDGRGRRGFKVFTYGGGHVIVDVAGYFTGSDSPPATEGLFVPVPPVRILDTRRPGEIGRLWRDWVVEAAVPGVAGQGAQAVVGNVTAVDARDPGFFTVYGAGTFRRAVSNLNANVAGQTVANHFISRISTRGLAVYSDAGAHVLLDMAGWYVGQPAPAALSHRNPPPPSAAPPWRLEIPALRSRNGQRRGLVSRVLAGSPNPIVDAGNTWHWTGTGFMGRQANVGLFAHRTDAGAPLYNLHELQPGDEMFVVVDRPSDRRRFRYRVVRTDLVLNVRASTSANAQKILAATRLHPGTTLSVIACTEPNRLPTSLDHRLIVTGELVDVVEV